MRVQSKSLCQSAQCSAALIEARRCRSLFVANFTEATRMSSHAELVKRAASVTPEQAHSPSNPKVYFDIKIGDPHAGRLTFEV